MKAFLSILAAAAAVCTAADAKTLTTLREVAEVCRTSSDTNDVFDLNCKISYFYQSHSAARWRLVATEGADEIVFYETKNARSDFGADEMPHLNDIFHIKGNFFLRDGAWCAGYTSAELVRRGSIGPQDEISADEVNAHEPRRDVVRLKGVVRDATRDETDPFFIYMTLNVRGSIVHVMVHTFDSLSANAASMIGRNVTVDGLIYTPVRDAHRYSGRYISVSGLANVHVEDGPPASEDAVPDISDIGHIPPQDIVRLGRHKAAGTVRAVWGGKHILLETDAGEMVFAEILGGPLPEPGGRISATGFPETDTFFLHLDNAAWTPTQGCPLPRAEPENVSIDALMKNDNGMPHVDVHSNGREIRFTGLVRFRSTDAGNTILVESEGHLVTVDLSALPEENRNVETGAKVSVAGTYVIDAERATLGENVPKARGFFVVPHSPDGISVLSRPSWWTTGRLVFVICLLGAAILAIVAWNAALRILVERRSREVVKAQARKMESELRIGERTRLAADLHDSISQNLTVIGYQVSAAKNTLGGKDRATAERLDTAAKMIQSCRTDLRRCLWDLRNNVLDEPDFAEAVRRTVAPVAGEASVDVRFSGPRSIISDATAHAVLNIVRELVANAVRHGKAKSVRISGSVDSKRLEASVRDDGCGFDAANRPRQENGHFGLDGIVERLERIGGTFELESAPGKGTCATIKVMRNRGNP